LGVMYGTGVGVKRSYAEAYFWLSLAAAQGAKIAKANRDLIEKLLTREQITAAQKRSAAWEPKAETQ